MPSNLTIINIPSKHQHSCYSHFVLLKTFTYTHTLMNSQSLTPRIDFPITYLKTNLHWWSFLPSPPSNMFHFNQSIFPDCTLKCCVICALLPFYRIHLFQISTSIPSHTPQCWNTTLSKMSAPAASVMSPVACAWSSRAGLMSRMVFCCFVSEQR